MAGVDAVKGETVAVWQGVDTVALGITLGAVRVGLRTTLELLARQGPSDLPRRGEEGNGWRMKNSLKKWLTQRDPENPKHADAIARRAERAAVAARTREAAAASGDVAKTVVYDGRLCTEAEARAEIDRRRAGTTRRIGMSSNGPLPLYRRERRAISRSARRQFKKDCRRLIRDRGAEFVAELRARPINLDWHPGHRLVSGEWARFSTTREDTRRARSKQ